MDGNSEIETPIETAIGTIKGRVIFLDKISFADECTVTINGEIDDHDNEYQFEITFNRINFFSSIELDFDIRCFEHSFCEIQNSNKIRKFNLINHSRKINEKHRHFYFRTYDSVFEIIAESYELFFKNKYV